MKNFLYLSICVISLCLVGIAAVDSKTEPLENEKFPGERGYAVFPIPLGELGAISFAGEAVPIHLIDIYERLEREMLVNTYWQSNGLLLINRMNRYFPIIEPILKKNNIPDDFKYLAVIESGLTNVVSPAGATGFWQFLKGTAKEYDLVVNEEVDERYHLKKATEAACGYLQNNYNIFGEWTLAAAAYNGGHNGIRRRIEEQKVGSYYDLLLGEETGRYVFRILALKIIHQNPQRFGFNIEKAKLYPPLVTTYLPLDSAVEDFASFAKDLSINYKILKMLNPWLRKPYLKNGEGKTYYIQVPQGKTKTLEPHTNTEMIFEE